VGALVVCNEGAVLNNQCSQLHDGYSNPSMQHDQFMFNPSMHDLYASVSDLNQPSVCQPSIEHNIKEPSAHISSDSVLVKKHIDHSDEPVRSVFRPYLKHLPKELVQHIDSFLSDADDKSLRQTVPEFRQKPTRILPHKCHIFSCMCIPTRNGILEFLEQLNYAPQYPTNLASRFQGSG
jgi:hypothetical protein